MSNNYNVLSLHNQKGEECRIGCTSISYFEFAASSAGWSYRESVPLED